MVCEIDQENGVFNLDPDQSNQTDIYGRSLKTMGTLATQRKSYARMLEATKQLLNALSVNHYSEK